jgi:hypothetical protein
MASIKIKTNIGVVTEAIRKRLEILKDKEYLLRPVCFDVIDLMTQRIHGRGEDASGNQIGTYRESYLKLRQKAFQRSADKKIIVSLTRQLENDWSVIATPNGYGVGFLNPFNLQKARWVELQKNKRIFELGEPEKSHALTVIQDLTRQALGND